MNACATFVRVLVAIVIMAGGLTGCAHTSRPARMFFNQARLNARPVPLALDTGAAHSWVFSTPAQSLGIGATWLPASVDAGSSGEGVSAPIDITVGAQSFTCQLTVFNPPWVGHWLFRLGWKETVGVIGWRVIRHNILLFNGPQRTVSALPERPADLAGWVRIKVHPADVLLLEIPGAGAKPGTFLVDTGAGGGIDLAPEAWQTWRASHPHAASKPGHGWYLGRAKMERTEVAWAEEIALGPLTLTDVPVHPLSPYVMGLFASRPDFAGLLGVSALARMDLIVDAERGLAYARPAMTPGAPYPGLRGTAAGQGRERGPEGRQDWTVAENVVLDIPELISAGAYADGELKYGRGELDAAMASFDRAIAANPRHLPSHLRRGKVRAGQRKHVQAIADFTGALEVDPHNAAAYTCAESPGRIRSITTARFRTSIGRWPSMPGMP